MFSQSLPQWASRLMSHICSLNPAILLMVVASALISLGTIILLVCFVKKDYQAAVARGSGGMPSSFFSYLEVNFFRLFRTRDPYATPKIPTDLWLQRGFLESLPMREGTRPKVVGLAPQRQISQVGPKPMGEALANIIIDFARANEDRCYLGRSTFKNNNTALFARTHSFSHTKYRGEVCHAHPTDGSMHVNLHPADICAVVEARWGERHPLARHSWWFNLICPVPAGLTLVYSPRNEKELEIMKDLVNAAAWWVNGIDSKAVEDSWS